jgi:DNA primase
MAKEKAMGLLERARTAKRWADLFVQELSENLRQKWAEEFAIDLSEELQEQLDEDFQEDLSPMSAKQLSEDLAAELRFSLLSELQEDLPQDIHQLIHDDLENLLFQQLTKGTSADHIHHVAVRREEELAELWARWVAGELTSHLLHRLADRMEEI